MNLAGRKNFQGGPHAAREPRVGHSCVKDPTMSRPGVGNFFGSGATLWKRKLEVGGGPYLLKWLHVAFSKVV
jgi:hypothetical protein